MSEPTFKPGARVYSVEGRAALFVASVANGFAVEPLYEHEDYLEEMTGNVEVWQSCFAKAPTEVWDKRISELRAETEDHRACAERARQSARNALTDAKLASERYKDHPDLRNLDMWLAGKVTHLAVVDDYRLHIGTVEEVLMRTEDRQNMLRLCSVFVDPKANRYWTSFAMYSDGSSSSGTRCLLATSREDALTQLLGYVLARLKDIPHHMRPSLLLAAAAAGVTLPESLSKEVEDAKAASAAQKIKQARESVEQYQRHLAAAEATLSSLQAA
ncbi:MAG TPA: hypothetical protein VGE36_13510 [Roseateles sp.]